LDDWFDWPRSRQCWKWNGEERGEKWIVLIVLIVVVSQVQQQNKHTWVGLSKLYPRASLVLFWY
jgi:hypothetical protein